MPIKILGIESSCDETSAAIIQDNKILSNVIANQEVHEKYGGVVPELASRAHQKNIIPVVKLALSNANIEKNQLDAIAYTRGPGLLGSLLVGASFAKSFSMSLGIPLIEVNHMQAHLLCHFIEDNCKEKTEFPFLGVNISGGHTQIVRVKNYLNFELIGETIDDAAGEAFDKSAKLLGLPYPGGPLIDKYAKDGNPNASAYSSAKAGIIGLTKSLGKELADKNIAVNAVTPSTANTKILDQMSEKHVKYMLSKVPRARFLELEEFSSLVCWLSTEENSFSTAAVFDISGGRSTY